MKNWRLYFFLLFSSTVTAQEPLYNFVLFSNSRMSGNYFYSEVSYQSPSWIENSRKKIIVSDSLFFTPGNSLKLHFVNGNGDWRVELFRPNLRGQDHFKPMQQVSFRMYISSATTAAALPAVLLGYNDSSHTKKVQLSNYVSALRQNTWIHVTIPLHDLDVPANKRDELNSIVFEQNKNDGDTHTIYLDEIELSPADLGAAQAKTPSLKAAKGYARHVDIEWEHLNDTSVKYIQVYRSVDNEKNFRPIGIQYAFLDRYTDFTGEENKTYHYKIAALGNDYTQSALSNAVSASTRHMDDSAFLTMIQEACFRYYWEGAENQSGLSKENIPGRHNMIATGASGFGILALIAGAERKFIAREQLADRMIRITNFLERADKFHGAFSHFIDGTTGKTEPFFGMRDNGGDLVETSFLIQGLLAARAYFDREDAKEKQIRDNITRIWQNVEWNWYRKEPESKFLTWHWSPDQEWVINHQLIGWNETMVTYLLAMASPTHPVPVSLYYSGWANLDSTGKKYRSNWGGTSEGSGYTNGNTYYGIKLDVGVSTGGPLFFVHYSYLGFDPHFIHDVYTNYFTNNRSITLINYRYCIENPGNYIGYSDSCWGLTASDGPYFYMANEPVLHQDNGKMAPTGAVSSFPYMPNESMKALKNYYYNYGKFLWGEYGFRDAFNLTENWCSDIYMGLNQAPMAVMIENYRTGLLWKLFSSVPEVQEVLRKLSTARP